MPLSPTPTQPPPTNVNNASNRLAAPDKQVSSLTASKWPLVAASVYTKLCRASSTPDADVAKLSRTIRALAHGKNKLSQALMAWDAAMRETRSDGPTPSPEVHNELRRQRSKLEDALLKYPLEVR